MRQANVQAVALVSLGCPKNLVDSECILAQLAEAGYAVGADLADADVAVINTCGFLSAAREESLEIIREAVALKRRGRLKRVVVCGCLVSRDAAKLYKLAPGIDAIVGANRRSDVLAAVRGRGRVTRRDSSGSAAPPAYDDTGRLRLTPRHTAYLRIAEGCGQRCSFCTIPAIRGPFRSKTPDAVLAEAQELVADGAVELNLIAQDTTAYGTDLPGRVGLAGLLRRLDRESGARWIRLMYVYPRRFSDAVISALADCQRVVPYVDIPLQHINDALLRRMGRRVTRKTLCSLLDKLRARVEGVAIRTAFIVGFPGETDEQFAELLDFVREQCFEAMGVFGYSPEEGTPAARLGPAVPEVVAQQRYHDLMTVQQQIVLAANAARVGSELEMLVDGPDAEGRTVARHAGQAPEVDSVCYLLAPGEHTGRPAGRTPSRRANKILASLPRPGSFLRGRVIDFDAYDLVVQTG